MKIVITTGRDYGRPSGSIKSPLRMTEYFLSNEAALIFFGFECTGLEGFY